MPAIAADPKHLSARLVCRSSGSRDRRPRPWRRRRRRYGQDAASQRPCGSPTVGISSKNLSYAFVDVHGPRRSII
ncbi:MAG: hypothetical protein DCC69_03560 [Hyphomicrobiales bacterium]|nr:MAG: hypothetical protein DCC69_03560 [Hyphomicrobiales bacterium]